MSVRRVGYVVSRFPKTTETFIAREMAAVVDAGIEVDVVSLVRETDQLLQPEAEQFVDSLRAVSDLRATEMTVAQMRSFLASPARWFRMWRRALWGNRRSRKFLLRAAVAAFGAPALARSIERRQIEHLHAHWGTHAALLAYLLHVLTDIPYSVTLHAHDLHTARTMLGEKLAASAAVVTISTHNHELITELYPDVTDRLSVVRCGVDTAKLVADRATGGDATGDRPARLVMVAGLRGFKGHVHLLDAVAALADDGRIVDVDLVGDGPLRQPLEALCVELGIERRVTFHGAVPVDRAVALLSGAEVALMPSVVLADGRRDGIPVALIEAMAVGTPVVASSVSGIPELVIDGETGLLVEPADPDALANAIRDVMDDPESAADRAVAARRLVESDYDIRHSGGVMIEIWNRVNEKGDNVQGVQMKRPAGPRVAMIAGMAFVAGLIALVWGVGQSDVYRAEAVVTFAPSPDLTVDADVIDVIGALDRGSFPETAAGLASSGLVVDAAAARIGLDDSGDYAVGSSPVFDANLLDIVVRGPDPVVAADLANAVADVLSEQVTVLYRVYVVNAVTRATPPNPASRNVALLTVAAALLGGALAAGAILVLDRTGSGRDSPPIS